ncbi:hypothetical protein DM02DRAFT_664324 [Periconia macrospinosa]|uniref:Uncharacterized protein n=1 Tax=Periconia macrospinosa TaxID=97972 RepID=A0A2V1CZG7_9PLEO|nr:hypothetical protein DM02DRAFT_664324 [Periconia macrospinosa]
MENSTNAPLLTLPLELRLQIYALVLGGEVFDIYCWRCYLPFGFTTRIIRKRQNFLALLAISRAVRSETRLLPFQLNAFRFKDEDAFRSWFDKFSVEQLGAIREVRLVTWMARHMVQGQSWRPRPMDHVFAISRLCQRSGHVTSDSCPGLDSFRLLYFSNPIRLPGLRRVEVEVRGNGGTRGCTREACSLCEDYGDQVRSEEDKFRKWVTGAVARVEVGFERVAARLDESAICPTKYVA